MPKHERHAMFCSCTLSTVEPSRAGALPSNQFSQLMQYTGKKDFIWKDKRLCFISTKKQVLYLSIHNIISFKCTVQATCIIFPYKKATYVLSLIRKVGYILLINTFIPTSLFASFLIHLDFPNCPRLHHADKIKRLHVLVSTIALDGCLKSQKPIITFSGGPFLEDCTNLKICEVMQ